MTELTVFLLIVAMSAIQYFMATRNPFILGVTMPVIFIGVMTWLFITNRIENNIMYIVLLIVGLILLIEEWVKGRKALRNRRQKEMNKMKTKDL
jgi:undecaprenyl pyrophosphate phosphatase UppP